MLRARVDLLESVGSLLYDATLWDGKLLGPSWRPQGGVRFEEIAPHVSSSSAAASLSAMGCGVDYYAFLGVEHVRVPVLQGPHSSQTPREVVSMLLPFIWSTCGLHVGSPG